MNAERGSLLEADLTWTGERFEPGVQVAVDPDGWIVDVGDLREEDVVRMPARALLPGFVSVHSHAFQRGLRGRGETFAGGAGSFWTWREEMYALVESLDVDRFRSLSRAAFEEMRAAGITAVGEFHYLRHASREPDFAFDEAILEAADGAGIRIVLLPAYYRTGGIGEPLIGAQRRFATDSVAAYWEAHDALARRLDRATQSLGAAAHSVRAATPAEIGELHAEARRRGLPFHLHAEEQPAEIEASIQAYGMRPLALVMDATGGAEGVTAVHGTHADSRDLARFVDEGGTLCVCPTTEANLGDGIPDLAPVLERAPWRLSLGTDGNARISMFEEMRWLEYAQRLVVGRRGIVVDEAGSAARQLLGAATLGGAIALGIDAGAIEPGQRADLVAIDLEHPSLADVDAEALLSALIFGVGNETIAATCVAGEWREARGQ